MRRFLTVMYGIGIVRRAGQHFFGMVAADARLTMAILSECWDARDEEVEEVMAS